VSAEIRLAQEDDAESLLAIYAPVVRETTISFEIEPPTIDEFRRRIRTTLAQRPWLVCEVHGDILGYAYGGAFRTRSAYQWTVEVTVYVHRLHRRRGIARALYTSLLECLRLQGYRTALAGIALPNPGSIALHESAGFEPVGVLRSVGYKLGRWCDVGWWQLGLQDYCSLPPSPRSLPNLVGHPSLQGAVLKGTSLVRA
jgi:L-amino acid N-acyltransferase YncA